MPTQKPTWEEREKKCSKCKLLKIVSMFGKDSNRKDGISYICRECCRLNSAERRKNPFYRQKCKELNHRYKWDKELKRQKDKKTYHLNKMIPEMRLRQVARNKLRYAVKSGKIQKLPCEVCGTMENVEGHHTDYNKALDVHWLCVLHHMETHGKEFHGWKN